MFEIIGLFVFVVLGGCLILVGVGAIFAVSAIDGKFEWPCLLYIIIGVFILFLAFTNMPFTISLNP